MLAAIGAGEWFPCFFIQMQFISETVYIWSGLGSVTWNGQMWSGVGSMLGIEAIEEGASVLARSVSISLAGMDPTLAPEFESDFRLGGTIKIYLGALTAIGGSIIADPMDAWTGRMGQPTFKIGADTATISIICENPLVYMNVPIDRRRTNDDQTQLVPGDLVFSFVYGIQEQTIYFGQTPTSTNNV